METLKKLQNGNKMSQKEAWSKLMAKGSLLIDGRLKEVRTLMALGYTSDQLKDAIEAKYARVFHTNVAISRKDNSQIDWDGLRSEISFQKSNRGTNYLKIFVRGNKNIYLASPIFNHGDYNKSVFCSLTEHNWDVCQKANEMILGASN